MAESDATAPRPKSYLIARRDVLLPLGSSFAPLDLDAVVQELRADPTVTVEREIVPQSLAVAANAPVPLQRVVVASMSDQRAHQLDQHPQLLIEENALLQPTPVSAPAHVGDPATFIPFGGRTTWNIRVAGQDGTPVAGAAVFLYGSGSPAQGETAGDGSVSLSLLNESDDTLRALFVNPQSRFWNLWIDNPNLKSANINVIRLDPLATTFVGFPGTPIVGWGQRTMRLDQVGPAMTGAGVKVAVIDSGAAAVTHPDLAQITTGRDFTVSPATNTGWENDSVAHGSHCSGMIAGLNDAVGIRGFAPAADVRELRIFPGGRFDSLFDALNYCIEQDIDVVNMSLGSDSTSDEMLMLLKQAKQMGVACLVAAGNTGGKVQFPGTSDDVLTVAAIGKTGEFPPNSFHARQIPPNGPIDRGYFSASFTCHGPEVDLCAPGVAIVSSVPPDGYAAWDGTSMATDP